MMTKKIALTQARRFAAALEGPLGPKPLQPAVEDFLDFFESLREAGASWTQIANLLFSVGVRTRSERPLSDAVLRAVVSRARARRPARPVISTSEPNLQSKSTAGKTTSRASLSGLNSPPGDPRSDVAERIRRAGELRARPSGKGPA